CTLSAAESLDQLIAAAKKEPELTFIAGTGAFGGPKAFSALEVALNKKFGLNARIRFAAGPEMNAMAARVITELKSGNKSSTDIYHGSQSHFSLLHQEKALEQVNWSGVFPWITKPMEIFPGEGVLIFPSPPIWAVLSSRCGSGKLKARHWWLWPARLRFSHLIFSWACRKIPLIRTWRSYSSPLWLRKKARLSWKNTSLSHLTWSKARRWRDISAIARSCSKNPRIRSLFT